MADFEDALSPPWANVIGGQLNCMAAVRRTLRFESPDGKPYALHNSMATLVVRPRGWHLEERHVRVDGEPYLEDGRVLAWGRCLRYFLSLARGPR